LEEVFKITLWLPDQQALTKVLGTANVILNSRAPKRETDGTFKVELFTTPAESKRITELGYRSEVDQSYGEVLKSRQKEVSKSDRFKGGKITPTGLGTRR
jgi:hypothetical protein